MVVEAVPTVNNCDDIVSSMLKGIAVGKTGLSVAVEVEVNVLYGAGAKVAQIFITQIAGFKLPLKEIEVLRAKWLRAYPSIAKYHKKIGAKITDEGMLVHTPLGRPVWAKTYTEALNIPSQGAGAETTKLALRLLFIRLPEAKLVNTVHDSITLECKGLEESKRQAVILKQCLDDSWLKISEYLPYKKLRMNNVAEVTKTYEGKAVWSTTL